MEKIQKQLENCRINDQKASSEESLSFKSIDHQKNLQKSVKKDIYSTKNDIITYQQDFLDNIKYTNSEEKHNSFSEKYIEQDPVLFSLKTDNPALSSLELPDEAFHIQNFSGIPKLREPFILLHKICSQEKQREDIYLHPPSYLTDNSKYYVFQSEILIARALTSEGSLKQTLHFDLDVKDYVLNKDETWSIGGTIGIWVPNLKNVVDEIFEILNISKDKADEQIILEIKGGKWPVMRDNVYPQKIKTTRRDLLTWTVDIQSMPPKKNLLRVLMEYAKDPLDKQLLAFLCSKEGQKSFSNLCLQKCITLSHLLLAFPSCKPSFEHLLSVLTPLSPRKYSLSNDPSLSPGILQIALTILQIPHWKGGTRPGVASAYFEQIFYEYINRKKTNIMKETLHKLSISIFRDHINPFAHNAYAPGSRIFIGVGVGIAPFRGFIQNRLQDLTCLENLWIIQGCRDSKLDEIYSGEWGLFNTSKNRIIVESRVGKKEHVQDIIKQKGKLIWEVINSKDGRIYVCGPGITFTRSIDECLIRIAMEQEGYTREDAIKKWKEFEDPSVFKYIKEAW
ncbi:hypothetical protein T552_03199 [Pneumocystis carinii B80]|uniref:FAD-binding FR-type domain-containing protein n=1 Tax=Pneumocystis carinii (strain B80) TaxID=1408658 RepID=A0A0W4ZC98_PNEC8|nr:hypothetical protein T552_03199 [Pneumocystis carinii B80]KTW25925.1 hypothetical protein T552_03199 [Pneumocystis carinii B80]